MNAEEKLLLKVCRCYFNNEPLTAEPDIDWNCFYILAKYHSLIGICHCVFSRGGSKAPEKVKALFQDKFFDLVYLYNCQENTLSDIRVCLRGAEIPFIVFKGAVLRQMYSVPESRSMGDIDILITDANRSKAKKHLENAGFRCDAVNGTVREFSRKGIHLEVHTRLFNEFSESAFSDAFENARFDNYEGRLEINYHLAYLIAHIAHHYKFYGAGIRMILDLATVIKTNKIDLDKVLNLLAQIELDVFAKEMLTVCFRWFGEGKDFGRDISKTEKYLLKYGTFGELNQNKGAIITRKELEAGKSVSSPALTKLRLAFPPYDKMKNIPYIKFIEGRPWLTPYAWCYRFIYNFKNKKNFVLSTIKNIDDEKTQAAAAAELEYFEEIGLWHS